jgi:hypothetical protein
MVGTAHVIGNGASNSIVDIPVHFTVSCNIPTHSVPFDATVVIDTLVVDMMVERKVVFTQPVWCTQVVYDYAHKKSAQGQFIKLLESTHRKSSGHHAAEQCAKMGYDQVHLWGMDSIFRLDLSSQMDAIIPRPGRANMIKEWRDHWRKIFDTHVKTEFYVHTQGVNTLHPDYGEKINIISHGG